MNKATYVGIGLFVAVVIAAAAIAFSGGDDNDAEWVTVPMLVEYSEEDGTPIPEELQPTRGTVRARRMADRVEAEVEMSDLIPGGVYSFWLAVWQDVDEGSPASFLASGGGAVADESGAIEGTMSAQLGDQAVTGWILNGEEVTFSPLHSPLANTMRVEAVYHGQADVAGDDLDIWLNDFWTGDPDICANPIGSQGTGFVATLPYCAGFYGASVPPSAE